MWGAILGAGVGGLADWAVAERSNEHSAAEARKADERSHRYWAQQNYLGPSIQRAGLEEAGFNPMLALGRSTSAPPTTHMGQTTKPDLSSSAQSMGRFMQEAIKDKVGAEIENVEADTELKDAQRKEAQIRSENTESSTKLIDSQKERSDLGLIHDIVSSIVDMATVGVSAHNAKTLGDLRTSSPKGSLSKPKVDKPPVKKPPAPSTITNSAKNAAAAAASLAPFTAIGAGLGYLEGKNKEREIKSGEHWNPKDKDNRKEKARKKWYLYHDIGF